MRNWDRIQKKPINLKYWTSAWKSKFSLLISLFEIALRTFSLYQSTLRRTASLHRLQTQSWPYYLLRSRSVIKLQFSIPSHRESCCTRSASEMISTLWCALITWSHCIIWIWRPMCQSLLRRFLFLILIRLLVHTLSQWHALWSSLTSRDKL